MISKEIMDYLDELFPNPKCELNYTKDYELLLAIMLSAQTTDRRVNNVTSILFKKYPSLEDIKNSNLKDLENIIRSIGNQKKKSIYLKEISTILVDKYNASIPVDKDVLITLPGIGRKTANVFLSEFYNYPAIAVDTHVERVSKRLRLAYLNDNVLDVERKLMKKFPKDKWARLHLQFVLFGRYYCKSVNPQCEECKLKSICRYYKKIKK